MKNLLVVGNTIYFLILGLKSLSYIWSLGIWIKKNLKKRVTNLIIELIFNILI